MTENLNPFEAVVRTSSYLEGLLRERGATGHGLIELARSIEPDLPPGVMPDVLRVGRIRNRVIHESVQLSTGELRTFLTGAQRIQAALRPPTSTGHASTRRTAPPTATTPPRPEHFALGILIVSALVLGLGLTPFNDAGASGLPAFPVRVTLGHLAALGLLGGLAFGLERLVRHWRVPNGVALVRTLYAVFGAVIAMLALFSTGGRMAMLSVLFLPVFGLILAGLCAVPLPRPRTRPS